VRRPVKSSWTNSRAAGRDKVAVHFYSHTCVSTRNDRVSWSPRTFRGGEVVKEQHLQLFSSRSRARAGYVVNSWEIQADSIPLVSLQPSERVTGKFASSPSLAYRDISKKGLVRI
jgi:hypothetical protein